MPSNCAVVSCKNIKSKTIGVSYFRFPTNIEVRNEWLRLCRRKDAVNPNTARICSAHFQKDDHERNLKSELLGIPYRPKLKIGAIPSLNLPLVHALPPPSRTQRSNSRSIRKRALHHLFSAEEPLIKNICIDNKENLGWSVLNFS